MGAGRSAVFFRVLLRPPFRTSSPARAALGALARAGRRGDARRHRLRLGLRSSRHGRSSTPKHLCRHHHDRDPRHDPGEGSLRVPQARHGRALGHGPVRVVGTAAAPASCASSTCASSSTTREAPASRRFATSRGRRGRVRGAHRAVRLRQVDASLSRGRFPTALRRHALARREAHHRAGTRSRHRLQDYSLFPGSP